MKIPTSIRLLYDELYEINKKLKVKVDERIISFKEVRWHYESRLKSLESFTLKIETGRISKPIELEDFFACTLVVENKSSLEKAENIVLSHFNLYDRRPPSEGYTSKDTHSFPFDDLRLYVRWKDDPMVRPTGIDGILFEVQIKTFLQHAWSIATHDLIYKSDSISWAKERIAYQIKAMLEHAEISILEAEKLAASQVLNKKSERITDLLKIIELLKGLWSMSDLPKDMVRLASNVMSILKSVDIKINRLREILDEETKIGRGVKTLNLSPYGIIIQSLLNQETEKLLCFLSSEPKRFKIFIPQEIDIPTHVDKNSLRNVIFHM